MLYLRIGVRSGKPPQKQGNHVFWTWTEILCMDEWTVDGRSLGLDFLPCHLFFPFFPCHLFSLLPSDLYLLIPILAVLRSLLAVVGVVAVVNYYRYHVFMESCPSSPTVYCGSIHTCIPCLMKISSIPKELQHGKKNLANLGHPLACRACVAVFS